MIQWWSNRKVRTWACENDEHFHAQLELAIVEKKGWRNVQSAEGNASNAADYAGDAMIEEKGMRRGKGGRLVVVDVV